MDTNKRDVLRLSLILLFLILLLALVVQNSKVQKNTYYDQQVHAAEKMKTCMEAIKSYKSDLEIPLSDEDYFKTGLIGEPFNLITTTLGEVKAKRTTAHPDMAALVVKMFHEVGLKKGNRVGLGFSGSFPALNIAVLCAAEEMELEMVPITSVGASTYGANNYALTFPEMLHHLYQEGLLDTDSAMVSLGGDFDVGVNIDSDKIHEIEERLIESGLNLSKEPDLEKNVQLRLRTYGQIDCFVAVGGNITNGGTTEEAITLGQGILDGNQYFGKVDAKSGIIQHYLSKEVPVINLLNIEKITLTYGMPFDPIERDEIGTGTIYYTVTYPKFLISIGFLTGVSMLIFLYRKRGA
ncbi:poly-gamma-glutamate system protein [Fusibacter ferrireducens]|uniref:Poly-gamma-glutamate system protein n=1 Tax=Fusibacter ferrireducens TaxID=2785058 RepID=A0ABR9ZYV0_9FIRM|nr:poly-gamma-glutamate system protein [Fusibacter ferrireducens]MBF4695635.1 poly-gamma-glutamate system protein [Fusibacter ferrireducens]